MKKRILSLIASGLICSSMSGIFLTNASESSVKGDINSDGVFDVTDVFLFRKWITGTCDIDMNNIQSADLNNDSRVNIADFCFMKNALLSAEPVSPISPVSAQPIKCDDIGDARKMIIAGDVSVYPEDYRNDYSAMFGRFNDDGFILQATGNTDSDEGIKLVSERGINLIPYAKFEDSGVMYHYNYKGQSYQVFIYFTDQEYSGQFQSMSEYNDLRLKFKDYEEDDNKNITAHITNDDSTQIISYSLIDRNHYCRVQTYASDEELTEFMNELKFKKIFLNAPLLLIYDRTSDGYYYNSVITEDGNRYTAGVIFVEPSDKPGVIWSIDDNINYIISQGEKKSYIEDTEVLQKISYIANNAAKYGNCKMTEESFRVTDGCETSLELLYNDENGVLRQLPVYYAYCDCSAWLDDKEIQDFVRMMIERGYIGRKDFLDTVDGNDKKTN